jgi:ribosomal-protein-alanine N-acetyltransferase
MDAESVFLALPELHARRLSLRQIGMHDLAVMHALRSDDSAALDIGEEPFRTEEQTGQWIQDNLEGLRNKKVMTWTIVLSADGAAIGECCLWNFDDGFHRAEVGFELLRDRWGQGLMREALSTLLHFGFSELRLHRIEADTLSTNVRALQLLRGLGFTDEAILRERTRFRGRHLDRTILGITNAEWGSQARES